ncbi:hypothetical protein NMG60_11008670 [Bertholletia excelsa]
MVALTGKIGFHSLAPSSLFHCSPCIHLSEVYLSFEYAAPLQVRSALSFKSLGALSKSSTLFLDKIFLAAREVSYSSGLQLRLAFCGVKLYPCHVASLD